MTPGGPEWQEVSPDGDARPTDANGTTRRDFLSHTARAGAAMGAAAWITPIVRSVDVSEETAGTSPPASPQAETTMAAPVAAGSVATTSTTTPSSSTTVPEPRDDGLPITGASIAALIAAGGAAVAGGKTLLQAGKRRNPVVEGSDVDPETGDSG